MPELEFSHHIEYTTNTPVPIPEIVDALLGLERIIKRTPHVLEALFPDTKIYEVKVLLTDLKSGSLLEDVLVKLVFGTQKEFDVFIEATRKKCRIDVLKDNKGLFGTLILALILGGGYHAISKSGSDVKKILEVQGNNNTIINIGAGMMNTTPEDFQKIIETAVKRDTGLANDAIAVIKPAKQSAGAEIIFDRSDELKVNKATVSSIPSYLYQEDEDAEHFEDAKDVSLEIRAMDLDHKRQGWAAVVPEKSKERARLQIDAIIDLETLKGKTKLHGDVTLVWLVGENNKKTLKRVILRELKKSDR